MAHAENTYIDLSSEEIDVGLVSSSAAVTTSGSFGLNTVESVVVEINVGDNLESGESVTVTPLFNLKGGNRIGYPLPSDLGGAMVINQSDASLNRIFPLIFPPGMEEVFFNVVVSQSNAVQIDIKCGGH